jgi:hypothetical protein
MVGSDQRREENLGKKTSYKRPLKTELKLSEYY